MKLIRISGYCSLEEGLSCWWRLVIRDVSFVYHLNFRGRLEVPNLQTEISLLQCDNRWNQEPSPTCSLTSIRESLHSSCWTLSFMSFFSFLFAIAQCLYPEMWGFLPSTIRPQKRDRFSLLPQRQNKWYTILTTYCIFSLSWIHDYGVPNFTHCLM